MQIRKAWGKSFFQSGMLAPLPNPISTIVKGFGELELRQNQRIKALIAMDRSFVCTAGVGVICKCGAVNYRWSGVHDWQWWEGLTKQ